MRGINHSLINMRRRKNKDKALFFIFGMMAIIVKNRAIIFWRIMIEKVEVYMGEKKLRPEEIKNYICTNEYVSDVVNEVYYKYYPERKPRR